MNPIRSALQFFAKQAGGSVGHNAKMRERFVAAVERAEAMEREIELLTADRTNDTERMNFIQERDASVAETSTSPYPRDRKWSVGRWDQDWVGHGKTLREAIDNAMAVYNALKEDRVHKP